MNLPICRIYQIVDFEFDLVNSNFNNIKETFRKCNFFFLAYLSKGSCASWCIFHLLAEVQVMCIQNTPWETHPLRSLVVLRQPTKIQKHLMKF